MMSQRWAGEIEREKTVGRTKRGNRSTLSSGLEEKAAEW